MLQSTLPVISWAISYICSATAGLCCAVAKIAMCARRHSVFAAVEIPKESFVLLHFCVVRLSFNRFFVLCWFFWGFFGTFRFVYSEMSFSFMGIEGTLFLVIEERVQRACSLDPFWLVYTNKQTQYWILTNRMLDPFPKLMLNYIFRLLGCWKCLLINLT